MKKLITVAAIFLISCTDYSAAGLFNEGNRAYREEQWKEARGFYLRALDKSFSDRMSALIYYNLGNTTVKEISAALSKSELSGDAASDRGNSAGPADRWTEALELYCLAQQFYGEPFPEAAINAEWVRHRLNRNTEERNNGNGENRDNPGTENHESDGTRNEKSDASGNSSPEKKEENPSEEENSDSGDVSESRSDNGNDEKKQNSASPNQRTDNINRSGLDEQSAEEKRDSGEASGNGTDSLSKEEEARMREALELLEQEEISRRQRPSFRRLPSYDDTEKNW